MTQTLDAATPLTETSDVRAFLWEREPDPGWVATLRSMRPMTDEQAGLVIAWEPGDKWEPIQRWFVYEVLPKRAIPAAVLAQLEGPHPRSTGHGCFGKNEYGLHCLCPIPKMRWVDGPAPGITRQAWLLYRKYGGWARPLWVVQGRSGGHKYRYTQWESRLCKAAGVRPEPPVAGNLPYAEPDGRTWDCLGMYADPDILKMYRGIVGYGMRNLGALEGTEQKVAEFAATQILKSFGMKAREHADELSWAMRNSDTPRGISAPDVDMERGMHDVHAELTDEIARSA